MDWGTILVAAIPGFLALIAVLAKAQQEKKQVEATTTDLITGAAEKAVKIVTEQLEATVGNLKECKQTLVAQGERIETLEQANRDATAKYLTLRSQVIALGGKPANGA